MSRLLPVLLLALLAACGRPLTPAERSFAAGIQGQSLDTESVRIVEGNLIGWIEKTRPPRPQVACRERIFPPEEGPHVKTSTAAFVLNSKLFVARPYYLDDYLAEYPEALPLARAMLLAHELTHVWQWQNRQLTGYAPFKAAAEQIVYEDPYLFEVASDRAFLDYHYEQQAALVEEFVCCRALDPEGARTSRLHALLTKVFPDLPRTSPVRKIDLPWKGAEIRGICS